AVRLEHVAALEIEDQAADDLARIERERTDRPAELEEARAHVLVRALLPLADVVVDERVVHVVADGAHGAQVERAVAEHAAASCARWRKNIRAAPRWWRCG